MARLPHPGLAAEVSRHSQGSTEGRVNWRKATASMSNGHCVEVASCEHEVLIRDSKRPEDGHLTVTPAAWRAFTTALRRAA